MASMRVFVLEWYSARMNVATGALLIFFDLLPVLLKEKKPEDLKAFDKAVPLLQSAA